jgi:hypothetical protein
LGYILRTIDQNRTRQFSDILIESNLFHEIKKLIYDPPYISSRVALDKFKNNFKNMNYVIINNWLDFSKSRLFFKLFPQYQNLKQKYDIIVEKTCNFIMAKAHNQHINVNIFDADPDDEKANQLCNKLITMIDTTILNQQNAEKNKTLIKNIIMQPKLAETYLEILVDM